MWRTQCVAWGGLTAERRPFWVFNIVRKLGVRQWPIPELGQTLTRLFGPFVVRSHPFLRNRLPTIWVENIFTMIHKVQASIHNQHIRWTEDNAQPTGAMWRPCQKNCPQNPAMQTVDISCSAMHPFLRNRLRTHKHTDTILVQVEPNSSNAHSKPYKIWCFQVLVTTCLPSKQISSLGA